MAAAFNHAGDFSAENFLEAFLRLPNRRRWLFRRESGADLLLVAASGQKPSVFARAICTLTVEFQGEAQVDCIYRAEPGWLVHLLWLHQHQLMPSALLQRVAQTVWRSAGR